MTIAVGFYVDASGASHSYLYNIHTKKFFTIPVSGAISVTATGINNKGTIVGFFNMSTGPTRSFLVTHSGHFAIFGKAGADLTQAFGVNDSGEVVGAYTIGAQTFGFTWRAGHGFHTVNDPHGVGSTLINGVNDAGDLVGFYTAASGHTDGMLAPQPHPSRGPARRAGPRLGA